MPQIGNLTKSALITELADAEVRAAWANSRWINGTAIQGVANSLGMASQTQLAIGSLG